MNTVSVGDLGEVMAITKFTQANCIVSKPFSNNARYDLIVEIDNKLYRVQVKTTTSIKDAAAMVFSTKTTNYVKGNWSSNKYTKEEIDMFFLYCQENNWCGLYFGDEDGTFKQELTLRLIPSKNGQTKGIRFATDYEFNQQLENLRL